MQTYVLPLLDRQNNKLHFEFSPGPRRSAFTSTKNLDKIILSQFVVDSDGQIGREESSQVLDLKGLPDRVPKSVDVRI